MATQVSPERATQAEPIEYREPGLIEELKRFHGSRFDIINGDLVKAPTTEVQEKELDRIRMAHGKADSKLATSRAVLSMIRERMADFPELSDEVIALCGAIDQIDEARDIYGVG